MTVRKNLVIWLLYLTTFVYSILDAYHTQLLLATGLAEEVNPIMLWVLDVFGTPGFYYAKLLFLIPLFFLLLGVTNGNLSSKSRLLRKTFVLRVRPFRVSISEEG